MSLLPFGKLAAHRPRTFVPEKIDLGDWPQIAPLFDQLERRAAATALAAKVIIKIISFAGSRFKLCIK
jgi:hypothetical protein